jgi:outer membrane protein assembly factor BamB
LRLIALAAAALTAAVGGGEGAHATAGGVPTETGSPWPSMRHDPLNTGRSQVRGRYHDGDRPWAFRTGKGIFSTPVIGADGTVYAGSADTWFYAVGPKGRLRWRFKTGEVIDSAGVLGRGTVTFGSGDEYVYRLRSRPRRLGRRKRTVWRFRATREPAQGQLVNWWEGNVTMGPGGVLYAGNTGGAEYAINPNGRLRWLYPTGNSVWSNAAIAPDGTVYFGSIDLNIYAVDSRGRLRWQRPTAGFVTSSPAIGPDGTVYIGSFDGALHALDPRTGADRWTFATGDHVYASPAIGERAVYIASTDGSIYALDRNGRLRWRYDTGDPVRSSPVLGRAPKGNGRILYVGSSNGVLYAIDADTGRRRWSFDTTPDDAVLRDRNDLNGSPALGRRGVYVGGEHGRLVYVPYDWCLEERRDRRCDPRPGEAFAQDELTRMAFVTSGGSTRLRPPAGALAPATAVTARLLVRDRGGTVDAGLTARPAVTARPGFDLTTQPSGDGHFLHVLPTGFLKPRTTYRLRVTGSWSGDGKAGRVRDTIRFRTAPIARRGPPLEIGRRSVSAFSLRRLAVPLPPILPSLNQIGFDSYDLVVGALEVGRPGPRGVGRVLLWAVSTRPGRDGVPVADRRGAFAFPLQGRYRHDSLLLSQSGLSLTFSFGEVPMRRFDLRLQVGRGLRARPGASLYAEVFCPEVPVYGPALIAIGLCNRDLRLPVSGTFITKRYDRRGPANRRPRGVHVKGVSLRRPTGAEAGSVTARLALARGARFPAGSHAGGLLLTDSATGKVVSLDYKKALSQRIDRRGDIREVRLRIPAGTELPTRIRAYVIADVFPLTARDL